jgi:hypothetical protein
MAQVSMPVVHLRRQEEQLSGVMQVGRGDAVRRGAAAVKVQYRSASDQVVDTTLDQAVLGELAGSLPVREFRWHRGQRHYSGWYWSSTMQGLVAYESRLELARIMLADFDPDVTAIAGQPFRLIGADGARIRRHVPDILLVMADGGAVVVDVKSPHKRDAPDVRAVMKWTRATVGLRGWGFEEWYGAPPDLLTNVRFLAGYRRPAVIDESLIAGVRESADGPVTITDLERSVAADSVLVRPVILHLLWTGELAADLERPLNGLSTVAPRESLKAGQV